MTTRLLYLNKLLSLINNYFDAPYPATTEQELQISVEAKTAIWDHLAKLHTVRHHADRERNAVAVETDNATEAHRQ